MAEFSHKVRQVSKNIAYNGDFLDTSFRNGIKRGKKSTVTLTGNNALMYITTADSTTVFLLIDANIMLSFGKPIE